MICINIHDSPLQITYHRFLKLVYPDGGEAEISACIMLNEWIGNPPETPDGRLHLLFGDHLFPDFFPGPGLERQPMDLYR
jgi:hypothetical protein